MRPPLPLLGGGKIVIYAAADTCGGRLDDVVGKMSMAGGDMNLWVSASRSRFIGRLHVLAGAKAMMPEHRSHQVSRLWWSLCGQPRARGETRISLTSDIGLPGIG